MTDTRHTVSLRADVHFDVFVAQEAEDPVTQHLANNDPLLGWHGRLLLDMLHPGQILIDLGAHVGTFALAAAALGCKVLAVEASPRNAGLLRRSAATNGFSDLHVIEAAVTDHVGSVDFLQAGPWGHIATDPSDERHISVQAVTVDELLDRLGWQRADVVKMDVEGSEVAAIRGMKRLLSGRDAPSVIYESNSYVLGLFGRTTADLIGAFSSLGYSNYLVEPARLVTLVDDGQFQPETVVDILAVRNPPNVPGWTVVPALCDAEIIAKVEAEAALPYPDRRASLARALRTAPPHLMQEDAIQRVLAALRNDPDVNVRAAAMASTQR